MEANEDIDLIVNHPKKAINKLAVPIIISNLFMMLNNIIDGIWVAGLGADGYGKTALNLDAANMKKLLDNVLESVSIIKENKINIVAM